MQNEVKRKLAPRRKRLLINPSFQAMFAVYSVVTTLIMVPIFIAANFYFFNLFSTKAHALGLPPEHELLQFVDRQQILMIAVFILATVFAILLNLILSYVFSNRIAGTLHRLTTVMNSTETLAEAGPVQPRDKDFFKELYLAYSQLIERFKS